MEVSEAIAKRKSVRAYEDRPVPADVLAKIVEAGRWAPNTVPFHLSVIRNQALRKKINDRTLEAMANGPNDFLRQRASLPGYRPLYGAPVLIVFSAPTDVPFGPMNTALAAENMLLEATSLGLGSCYLITPTMVLTGGNNELAREARVPEGYAALCAIVVGYAAAEDKFSLPERSKKGEVAYVD